MKRVAFILKGYPRVSETFIAQEIHLLERRGFDIEILSMRDAREPERQPIVERIRARVTYMPEYLWEEPGTVFWGNICGFLRQPARYARTALRAVARVWGRRSWEPVKRFLQAGWTAGRISFGPDGIRHLHAHFLHAPTEATHYLAGITGLPYTISAHAKDIYTLTDQEVVRRVQAAQWIMTCTEFNWRHLRGLPGIDPSKVHKVYHGIDVGGFRRVRPLPEGLEFASRLSAFVSVGRLVEKKGYDVVLAALHQLKRKGIAFTYDIYGTGDQEAALRQRVAELKLSHEVRFHGTATHPAIIERLNAGGIFLGGFKVTAGGDRDGIPNTVAEAMAMEMPVLATTTSGLPELIEHGKSGHLVPANDVDAFGQALEFLLANPEYSRALAEGGRARVLAVFDAGCCIEACAALFQPLLDE